MSDARQPVATLEFSSSDHRAGFRLHRLELLNWGTFDRKVWSLAASGENYLLTGEIGSGKSTVVDAITTLLVPPQKIAYNKAAGAESRERTLLSYVLGYYKSERSDVGPASKPVALRESDSYSVLLGYFFNEGYSQQVTLAQVYWLKEPGAPPARFYVVADRELSIVEHFSAFGTDISALKKRLRGLPRTQVEDSFPTYGATFRKRFGIENEQALDLFYQTVSMKSVGNLTDFVRQHMLEEFPIEPRIGALTSHFDDLNRAHDSVLRAKAQVQALIPICDACDEHTSQVEEAEEIKASRDALRQWFADAKAGLLAEEIAVLTAQIDGLAGEVASLEEQRTRQVARRDELKSAIGSQGGDRIERIKELCAQKSAQRDERKKRAEDHARIASAVGFSSTLDAATFAMNAAAAQRGLAEAEDQLAALQNELTEKAVSLRARRSEFDAINAELESLRGRRSNLPSHRLRLRSTIAAAVSLPEENLPFVGELLAVAPSEKPWEGAIERLLHGFALSLLVEDRHYGRVAQWVDGTHLGERLVYFRVREQRQAASVPLRPTSLVRKLVVKADSPFSAWLDGEVMRRYSDVACCDSIDDFRREKEAITRAGQIKTGSDRHEKDDRHRIDDRSRFVLGWSNEEKIRALEKDLGSLADSITSAIEESEKVKKKQRQVQERMMALKQLVVFRTFSEIDWKPLAEEIQALEDERMRIEAASDVLRELQEQLRKAETALEKIGKQADEVKKAKSQAELKLQQAQEESKKCQRLLETTTPDMRALLFPRLASFFREAFPTRTIVLAETEACEANLREWLQAKHDALRKKIDRVRDRAQAAMISFRAAYPVETKDFDASVEAADEYRTMLTRLRSDDLPRFEQRFKQLLNENTIREVAAFQSQLYKERQTICERIETINKSLREIDYNPGRFIELVLDPTADIEIREFQRDLKACTEGGLPGSNEDAYSEAKFLEVKRIIERFRGRDEFTEIDRRWARKVTDVRNWFSFAASERWREDNREHEHYTDSGGKSGGQKEKLAYTVLAASVAYQFGLEWGETRSRSFRFVVIDEAFGRGSDESARYGLELFSRLNLQLVVATPLQKIHVIEPFVAGVGFVHNEGGKLSMIRNLTIEEYRAERAARAGA